MLPNYDAKAVAEVMGIAFLRDPEAGPASPATTAKVVRSVKRTSGATAGKFVINVGDAPVRIVESRTGTGQPTHKADRMWPPSPVLIEKAVERGLPRLVLRHVAEHLAGGDRAKISPLEWAVVPRTTLERRADQLSPLESERTERVARLFVHAVRTLGTEAEARAFMTTPHPLLDGRGPIDAAKTDLGTRRAEQILNALEYGLAL
jgi:putative toxin-antitoxin system antitoxin component (TIGR02293 family)